MRTSLSNQLTGFDLTPLFRSSIGFDSLSRMVDRALKLDETASSYPPYNIEKRGQDNYRITMAVAGFAQSDLTITAQESVLIVVGSQNGSQNGSQGNKQDGSNDVSVEYLHRGIAARAFERRFQLADHVQVLGAKLENGLLHIELTREVPEMAKPRLIQIDGTTSAAADQMIGQSRLN